MKLVFCSSLIITLLITDIAFAKNSRFLALGGFGQAKATSAGRTSANRVESPGGISLALDQNYKGSYFIFVEHMRSLGAGGSSVGFTGLGLKYYPWASPLFTESTKTYGRSTMTIDGYLPYIGGSFGFGQASMLGGSSNTDDILAVAGYIAAKAGVETPLSEKWGLITEGNYMNSVGGSGSIQALNILIGGYLIF